ncbi:MAG: nucleotidyltransferase family protein [Bacilli bacterium]|nr:nucleotidyltransferase family protein [Bacilli bacterium]
MKKVLGLILELNPFHNGHKYFIDKAIEKVNPDIVIAIISGNYTMRGEASVVDKWTKTKLLLESKVEIVLELPFISAINSADFFALNSISILNKFKITDLAFGVELDNLEKLKKMKDIIDSDLFNSAIKEKLNTGLSYSASAFKVLNELVHDLEITENFTLPNNTLGIQYLRSIEKLNKNIKVHLIKRIDNNYYDKHTTNKISSATSLRVLLEEDKNIEDFIPSFNENLNFYNPKLIEDNILYLLKYNFYNNHISHFSNIFGVSEGIENRIYSFLDKINSYQELIDNVKTKRYTPNKIKRLILHIIMNTNIKYQDKANFYLRVLGASNSGFEYINTLPKTTKSKIITSFKNKEDNELVQLELKASKIYSLLTDQKDLYLNEFKVPVTGGRNDN